MEARFRVIDAQLVADHKHFELLTSQINHMAEFIQAMEGQRATQLSDSEQRWKETCTSGIVLSRAKAVACSVREFGIRHARRRQR